MISPIFTVEAARVIRTEKCGMRKTFSIVVEVFWEQMNKAMNYGKHKSRPEGGKLLWGGNIIT